MIGLTAYLDMIDFVKMPNMPNNLEFFQNSSKFDEIIQDFVDLSKIKRGEFVFGLLIAIDKDYPSKRYSVTFITQSITILKTLGWKVLYARSSNIYSRKVL
jgi:hypothetical protein